jgi:hypothetical protein
MPINDESIRMGPNLRPSVPAFYKERVKTASLCSRPAARDDTRVHGV